MIRLWDAISGQMRWSRVGDSRQVLQLLFSPDNKLLAAGNADHTVKLWDVATGEVQDTLRGHSSWVWELAFSPNGRILATSSGLTKLWDIESGRQLASFGWGYAPASLAFSPNGQALAQGGAHGNVVLWDVEAALSTPPATE